MLGGVLGTERLRGREFKSSVMRCHVHCVHQPSWQAAAAGAQVGCRAWGMENRRWCELAENTV